MCFKYIFISFYIYNVGMVGLKKVLIHFRNMA